MSRSRRVSATTSEPKPGALVPAGFGRSSAAISGWALRDAAASGLDFAMGGLLSLGRGRFVVGDRSRRDPIGSRGETQHLPLVVPRPGRPLISLRFRRWVRFAWGVV